MKQSRLLPAALLHQVARAVPAPDVITTAAPVLGCDAACLLRLIRYREQVNTDWLMALPFCSSLLQHEAYSPANQPASPPEVSTTTVTLVVTQTSAGFTFGQEVVLARHLAPMRADDDRSHQDICASYWASHKPRPPPWESHPAEIIRAACIRLTRGDSMTSSSFDRWFEGEDQYYQSAEAPSPVQALRVDAAPATGAKVATATAHRTVMTVVVAELDTTTTRVSTVTRTVTKTVTAYNDEGLSLATTGVDSFNV